MPLHSALFVSSGHDSACEIFNINTVNRLVHYDDELIDEQTRILNMTSLNTLLLLSKYLFWLSLSGSNHFCFTKDQTDSRNSYSNLNTLDKENLQNYRLTLAYERLSRIPKVVLEEFAPFVRILDISNNEFRYINFSIDCSILMRCFLQWPKLCSGISKTYLAYLWSQQHHFWYVYSIHAWVGVIMAEPL